MGLARPVWGVLCGLLVLSAHGFAADAVTGFYARKTFHQLRVDKDHVAVRALPVGKHAGASFLSAAEAKQFAQLGVDIVDRASVKGADVIVGYPVWFDKAKGAVGVLTHEIVVRTDKPDGIAALRAGKGFADMTEMDFKPGLYLAKFTSPMAALEAANEISKKPGVLYAHPNFLVAKDFRGTRAVKGPADEPFFSSQWHLENTGQKGAVTGADIHAKNAWEVTKGSSEVLVAILDGGFQVTHPDLDGAFFRNTNEIPGNGVDDDRNGYIDDVSGWNFWAKNNDPASAVYPDHGTLVAGLVGARENGKGVTGVCPRCTILPVVLSWTPVADAAAFYYAQKMGADIITNSWGYAVGVPTTDVVEEAIETVATQGRDGKGTVILFAMNNLNQDDCVGPSPDISSLEAVIAVSGASDQDKKVLGSAWGDCMEYVAPTFENQRQGIASTDLVGKLGYNTGRNPKDLPDLDYSNTFGGTSAATPISAGVFALILTVNTDLTKNEALAMVLATADKIDPAAAHYDPVTGFSNKYGYGRINAGKAVRAAQVFRKYTGKERAFKKSAVYR